MAIPAETNRVEITDERALKSAFPVTDLAAASFGAVGLALAALVDTVAPAGSAPNRVRVDRELASGWFYLRIGPSIPVNLAPPGTTPGAHDWMTEFRTADDRWLRVPMVFPRLRRRVVEALGAHETAESVAAAIRLLKAEEASGQLFIDAGAAVAEPQSAGMAPIRRVAAEPIVAIDVAAHRGDVGAPRRGDRLLG